MPAPLHIDTRPSPSEVHHESMPSQRPLAKTSQRWKFSDPDNPPAWFTRWAERHRKSLEVADNLNAEPSSASCMPLPPITFVSGGLLAEETEEYVECIESVEPETARPISAIPQPLAAGFDDPDDVFFDCCSDDEAGVDCMEQDEQPCGG